MIKYLHSLRGIADPVMADGTTAFSMALAKGRSDLICEFKGTMDNELARYTLIEPNISEEVRKVLEVSVGTRVDTASKFELSTE